MSDFLTDEKVVSESFYDPSEDDNKYVVIPKGDYNTHVDSLELKENIVVRGKFLADIFQPIFKIATGDFKGRKIKSKGFFRFKSPDKSKYPDLSTNMGSNKGYMTLVEVLGISVNKKEVDGKTLYDLPFVTSYEMEGRPATVRVDHDSWINNSGENITTPKVVNVFKWEDGKRDVADLPF